MARDYVKDDYAKFYLQMVGEELKKGMTPEVVEVLESAEHCDGKKDTCVVQQAMTDKSVKNTSSKKSVCYFKETIEKALAKIDEFDNL